MWMTNPRGMCRQHLLGEHVELHMFVGTFKKGIGLSGYFENDLIEPESIISRHHALVEEMTRRGYNHRSPFFGEDLIAIAKVAPGKPIGRERSLAELVRRCPECAKLMGAL